MKIFKNFQIFHLYLKIVDYFDYHWQIVDADAIAFDYYEDLHNIAVADDADLLDHNLSLFVENSVALNCYCRLIVAFFVTENSARLTYFVYYYCYYEK